ncbi:hypothetical protein [Glaciecola punicea]|jgi:hypothetical protein|uniref:hypothetical protein n=1 Tax=Glaciecola punicea TaxID=56804 RepID=UPI00114D32FC|nr:hypothetical protein [Glaciecola punicea]
MGITLLTLPTKVASMSMMGRPFGLMDQVFNATSGLAEAIGIDSLDASLLNGLTAVIVNMPVA